MARRSWQATVHRVTKHQTWLSVCTHAAHTNKFMVLVLFYLFISSVQFSSVQSLSRVQLWRCKNWGPLKLFILISKYASKPSRANILSTECFLVFSTLNSPQCITLLGNCSGEGSIFGELEWQATLSLFYSMGDDPLQNCIFKTPFIQEETQV